MRTVLLQHRCTRQPIWNNKNRPYRDTLYKIVSLWTVTGRFIIKRKQCSNIFRALVHKKRARKFFRIRINHSIICYFDLFSLQTLKNCFASYQTLFNRHANYQLPSCSTMLAVPCRLIMHQIRWKIPSSSIILLYIKRNIVSMLSNSCINVEPR